MAELIAKHPDRFVSAAACLPMNSMEAALAETDRAIQELGFKGVQIYSPTGDKPLDHPDFMPLYEKMAAYELPIWIHPKRGIDFPDYKSEDHSKYWIFSMFGWPYETTAAMTRLVFSGVMGKIPQAQIHHPPLWGHGPVLRGAHHRRPGLRRSVPPCQIQEMPSKAPHRVLPPLFMQTRPCYGGTPSLRVRLRVFGGDHLLSPPTYVLTNTGEGGDGYTPDYRGRSKGCRYRKVKKEDLRDQCEEALRLSLH